MLLSVNFRKTMRQKPVLLHKKFIARRIMFFAVVYILFFGNGGYILMVSFKNHEGLCLYLVKYFASVHTGTLTCKVKYLCLL